MALDINKVTQPYDYYLKFIKQNCRPDNRKLSDIRPCSIKPDCINTSDGSALAKLGSTIVVCGVSARLCRPCEERPNKGYIACNVELPALCSSKSVKSGSAASHQSASFSQSLVASASIEQTQALLTQLMQDILDESRCIDEKQLCIREGKLVWALYIDMVCLNNDGNVQDACCMAMINALKTVKLYDMDYDDRENKPMMKSPIRQSKLKLNAEPACTTIICIEDGILMPDPNKQEEDFMKAYVIVCTLDESKICLIRKFGGFSLSIEQVNLCVDRALKNGNYIRKSLYNSNNSNTNNNNNNHEQENSNKMLVDS
jgi:exosome complex component RRP43